MYSEHIINKVNSIVEGEIALGKSVTKERVLELQVKELAKAYDSAMNIIQKLLTAHI